MDAEDAILAAREHDRQARAERLKTAVAVLKDARLEGPNDIRSFDAPVTAL